MLVREISSPALGTQGAMDAAEGARLQVFIQLRQAAPQQMGPRANVEADVVVHGFDPVDVWAFTNNTWPALLIALSRLRFSATDLLD